MINIVTDPSKEIRYYFRVNSTPLPKTITFLDENGDPYPVDTKTWQVNFKITSRSLTNVISLTEGDGISLGTNSITIEPTDTQMDVPPKNYFIEFRNITDAQSWFTGKAIGHQGEFDNFETDDLTITVSNASPSDLPYTLVDDYGAVGDGVSDDTQAFRNMVAAYEGEYANFYLSPGKTYLISNYIQLYPGHQFFGYGAIIKRADEVSTTLTSTASASDASQTFTVTDASEFSIGDAIAILDVTAPGGGNANGESSNTAVQITNIVGNSITISGVLGVPQGTSITTTYPIGSKLVKVFVIFSYAGGDQQAKSNGWYGIEYDGNKSNNPLRDWQHNGFCRGIGYKATIKDCKFHDVQSETLFVTSDQVVENCHFWDINGSCAHIGNGSYVTDDTKGNFRFVNNVCRNVCIYGLTDVYNHAEGVVTVSTGVDKTYIHGNFVYGSGSSLFARTSAWEGNLEAETFIYQNRCYNMKSVFEGLSTEQINKNVFIQNNFFDTCEALFTLITSAQSNVFSGWGYDNWVVTGNTFINTKLLFRYATNLLVSKNTFITEDGFTFTDYLFATRSVQPNCNGTLTIGNSSNYRVTDNIFHNKSLTYDSLNKYAIQCNIADIENVSSGANQLRLIKENPYASTEFGYSNRNAVVEGNTIINYEIGISDWILEGSAGILFYDQLRRFKWLGLTIKNNPIQLRTDRTSTYGIIAGPGCEVIDNPIYGQDGVGIYVLGVNDGSGSIYDDTTLKDRIDGPLVENNTVRGLSTSILVANTGTAARGSNSFNARVVNNYVSVSVTDNSGGDSTVSGNTLITDENLPIFQVRENPEFYSVTDGIWNTQVEAWRAQGVTDGGTEPTDRVLGALSYMLDQLDDEGLLSSAVSFNVLFAGSKQFALLNVINPATRKYTEVDTVIFTDGSGCKSSGTSYFNQPFASNEFTGNNLTVVQYISESNAVAANESSHGMRIAGTSQYLQLRPLRTSPANTGVSLHYDTGNSFSNTNHKGLYIQTHNGTNNILWKDGVKDSSATTLVAQTVTNNRFVLARNNNGTPEEHYTSADVALDIVFNTSFTDAQELAFRNIFNYFKKTVGLP